MDTAAGPSDPGRPRPPDSGEPGGTDASGRSRDALYAAIETDGQRLAIGLIRLVHAMSDRTELNPTDVQCYLLLKVGGPQSPGEIADGLRLASGSVTGVIDRLVDRGLARRERPDEDRRRVLVHLNDERPADRVPSPGMRDAMTAVHAHYTEAELAVIADWLGRVGPALDGVASAMRPQ
ncbi:DNA-binding MarR family transcriptional regulator [Murinocardiopsis flavida]|uniref:DNA-binding MarR family transcriptional regulator n=1 Tax=Murinocardiopsis flavida TaxID=645275 RepID=A0A2P8CWQ1_9ACTN|nr:MarR family transcriptional regulator [Murinocardiopsis flavida]PSK89398.1 DNA-binding MarR family transcriptional regulator [Murinocardiopsis flavida]